MRPRIVLIFGSIIAMMLAAGEFYLIYQQNTIISRQSDIMKRQTDLTEAQTRLSHAQVVATLIPMLQSDNALVSYDSAQLSAYGSVATDLLLPIVMDEYPVPLTDTDHRASRNVWRNSARIIASRAYSLSDDQSRQFRDSLFTAMESLQGSTLASLSLETDSLDSYPTTISDAAVPTVGVARQLFEDHSQLMNILAIYVQRTNSYRDDISKEDYAQLVDAIIGIYILLREVNHWSSVQWSEQGGVAVHRIYSRVCATARAEDNTRIRKENLNWSLVAGMSRMQQTHPDASIDDAVEALVLDRCNPEALSNYSDPSGEHATAIWGELLRELAKAGR